MQTTDTGLLFQSSQQLLDASNREKKIVAAEKIGNPIKLSSKVLDVVVQDQEAWTAESGWQARRVDLNTCKTRMLYKGHKGPVTSIALFAVGGAKPWLAVITGSWDKTVRVWDAETGEQVASLVGHSDFVKSVTVLPTSPATLISTSSDKSFRLWDLSPLEIREAPTFKQAIKEHTRPVDAAASAVEDGALTVWTADSMGVLKQWHIPLNADAPMKYVKDLAGHETSIAQLAPTEDGLWSVSMDNSARLHGPQPATLPHPSYVKSILAHPNGLPYIVTGSEDEDIRVYSSAAVGDPDVKPLSVVPGHCGEVSGLATWLKDSEGKKEVMVVSVSLDGTLRRWSINDLLHPEALDYEPVKPNESGMTAEEEAELAELMSDDD